MITRAVAVASLVASLVASALLPAARGQEPTDYLVLVPRSLKKAVAPLVAHRAAEGLRVRVEVVEDVVGASRDRRSTLREVVRAIRPRYLLIAADVDAVPAFDVAEVATDRPYGDHDDDGLPEVSIGRLPTSDAAAMARMVARTIGYERDRAPGAWQKQCALVAGEGRFGPAIDALIENLFQRVVARQIPSRFDVDLTYANPSSTFCYPFAGFADRVVDRLNEGPLVMAYVGHGDVRSVDDLTAPDASGKVVRYPVLDATHVPQVTSAAAPIMVAIACWTGRYEGPEACIGEELLATGRGPVAFFGSSRISHPVPNALLGISLVGALFEDGHEAGAGDDRLGPRLDRARRALVAEGGDDPLRAEIMLLSAAFVAPGELRRELPRHVDMYNLLGDPALRLARPAPLQLEARVVGGAVEVRGVAPAGARGVTVTLEVTRDRSARAASPQETTLERYARANDKVLATAIVMAGPDGVFSARLPVPPGAPAGAHLVKAFATGETGSAAGATTCTLRGAPADRASSSARPAAPPAAPARTFH